MRRTTVLLAVALLLGGCRADSDDDPVTTGDAPGEQAEPGASSTTEGGPPPTFADDGPNIAPDGAPTADELAAVMPPADVLGDRFEMALEPLYDMDDTEIAAPFCEAGWPGNHLSEMWEPHDVGGISAGYAYDVEDEGPIVVVRAASFPDAAGHVRDAIAQVEVCAAAGPGEQWTYAIEGDTGLGDAGIAFGRSSSIELPGGSGLDLTATTDITLVAVGDVVVMVMAMDGVEIPGAPPADTLDPIAHETFVEEVVDRVGALR